MNETMNALTNEVKDIHDRYVNKLAFGNRNEKARASTVLDETILMMFRIARNLNIDGDEILAQCGVDVQQWKDKYKSSGATNKYRS